MQYYWTKFLKKARGPALNGSVLGRGSKVEPGSAFTKSTMGRHSFCGYDCDIFQTDIGHFFSITNQVVIGGGQHPVDWVGMSPVFYNGRDSVREKFSTFARPPHKRVQIGSDVWIGCRAIVLQGVRIEHGVVIGAGAVVTKDVEPYSIVAGVPARHIRYRFDEITHTALLSSCWWDRDDAVLEKCAHEICKPLKFLEALSRCE